VSLPLRLRPSADHFTRAEDQGGGLRFLQSIY